MSFELAADVDTEIHAIASEQSPQFLTARGPLPTASQFDTWGITSYTALSTGAKTDVARDVDDAPAIVHASARVQPTVAERSDFSAFPAGRRPGVVLHELFEYVDFATSGETLRASVSHTLRKYAMADGDSDPRIMAVTDMMERVLAAPVGSSSFALHDVDAEHTLREWEFLLPLGTVQRNTFADIFARHGGVLGASYVPLLRQLAGRRIHGFLKGFVDLVFEHGGRWYVVDWKSNQLGADMSAYSPPALREVMHESHYTLQYHLYVVALHRHLRARLPGYSYETHMGGAAYAFLRGFTADGHHGWYVDRPSLELVTALDELMDAGRVLHSRGAA